MYGTIYWRPYMANLAFIVNLEKKTLNNKNYRKVLFTTKQLQLVVMRLLPGSDIPEEKHPHTTQFIRVEKGSGVAVINGKKYKLTDGSAVVISSNTLHRIINTGKSDLLLYTIYSPPEHPPGTIQKNRIVD